MSSHTPGPYCDDCGCRWGKGMIIRCPVHAAAPELLAALHSTLRQCLGAMGIASPGQRANIKAAIDKADAAIARAEGKK